MECTRKIGTRCNKITVSKQPHAADTHPAVISAACFAALYTTQLQNPPHRSKWHAPSVTQHRTNTHLAEDSEPDTCSRVCCCWMLHLFPLSQDCTDCAAMQSTCLSLSGCLQPSRRSIEVAPVTLCMHVGWPSNCACGGKRHSALPRHIHSHLGQAPVVAPFGRKTPVGALCLNSTHSTCQPTLCLTHSVRTCHPHTGAGHSRTTHVRCWCC